MKNSDINHELLINFVDESLESLYEIENNIINLEKSPTDKDIINSIFRPFHSLKGNASYFGLMKITKLAHKVEDLLDALRNEKISLNQSIIDVILPSTDYLREMLHNVHDDTPQISDEQTFNQLIENIEKNLDVECTSISECKDKVNNIILQLEPFISSEGLTIYNSLKTFLHSTENDKLSNEKNLKEEDNSLTNFLLKDAPVYEKNSSDLKKELKAQIDNLKSNYSDKNNKNIIDNIVDIFDTFSNSDTGIDEMVISMILDEAQKLQLVNSRPVAVIEKDKEILKSDKSSNTSSKRTMRIPIEALDNFLKNVGELLSVEEMLKHFGKQLSSNNHTFYQNLKEITSMFENVSKNLRTGIMEIRKVEASNLLNKAPRIVRDIASKSNKKISVVCMGEDIKIDKSYIDLLDAPLTHIVRNSADHGIETIDERLLKGKDESGLILISVTKESSNIILKISDDGAGLNYAKLTQKALDLGIISHDHSLSDDEITELLFSSGVSTAETVTDVSGRGVGMDVVKKAIDNAGGKITVTTKENQGTTFTITLPQNASTQIIDGYIIRSFSNEEFVLPLSVVSEAFSINKNEITTVTGKGRIVTRRGIAFPLFNIDKSLGILTSQNNEENCMIVICELKNKNIALEVKEAIGIQKIVKKDVENNLLEQSLFEGAAVNGKGQIMLIINKDSLMKFN